MVFHVGLSPSRSRKLVLRHSLTYLTSVGRVGTKAPFVVINIFPLTSFVHFYLAHGASRTGVRLRVGS